MSPAQAARRYARALHEAALGTAQLPNVVQDIEALGRLLSELPELSAWCRQHRARAAAAEFVRTAFLSWAGPLTGTTLRVAAENGRLAAIPLLARAFEAERAAAGATVEVTLETAGPADAELEALVKARVESRTGRGAEIVRTVVPELVAGFRAFWQSRLWDCTARAQLAALRQRLTPGEETP